MIQAHGEIKKVTVKRYQVILNPDSDEETTLLGFLRQVNNVRIDLAYGNNISTSSEINQSYEKGKMRNEENTQKFYVQNQELIKKVFAGIIYGYKGGLQPLRPNGHK